MCLALVMVVVKNIAGPVLASHSGEVPIKAQILHDSGPAVIENLKNAGTKLTYLSKEEAVD